jgi:hypothetical protein
MARRAPHLCRCVVCGCACDGRRLVVLRGRRDPVCARDWRRLFSHTTLALWAFGAQRERGVGRPVTTTDAAIVAWAQAHA